MDTVSFKQMKPPTTMVDSLRLEPFHFHHVTVIVNDLYTKMQCSQCWQAVQGTTEMHCI